MLKLKTHKKIISIFGAAIFVVVFAAVGIYLLKGSHAESVSAAPTSPPVQICGNTSELSGPSSAPSGAITVPAGDNSGIFQYTLPANTTYYFTAGTHTLGTSEYGQIQAGVGDTFIGAPGAILSGQGNNHFAITGSNGITNNVTIKYLTIEDFIPPDSQGAVNTDSNDNWTIEYDTIEDNIPGAAMMVGSNNTIENNCLTQNGQYAFNGYQSPNDPESSSITHGPANINISDNEISYNDTCNWEAVSNFPITSPSGCKGAGQADGCGCSGGGKFWQVDGATYDGNYVHNNYNAGMWADTNNTGFDIEGNYFSNNYDEAIIYEISYNALMKDNTFVGNAIGSGPTSPGFPAPSIYISESGGESRVPGFSSGSLDITGNVFTNNWAGVELWENANRYCASTANSSSADCTLVNPTTANLTSCGNAADLATTPYINDCRWKTQNVTVSNNIFNLTPADVASDCTESNGCGFNGLFSEYGTYPPYDAYYVPLNISNNQNNIFKDNTYNGPWNFMGLVLGDKATWAQWTSGFNDSSSNDHFNAQDAGSTFNSQAAPTPAPTPNPSVPTEVSAIANSATSVTVSWTASTDTGGPGIGGYYVLRNGVNITPNGVTTTKYTDTSAVASTSYAYTVEAHDSANAPNVSGQSTVASVTTPSSPSSSVSTPTPSVPTEVSAAASTPTSVVVSWKLSTETGGSTGSSSTSGNPTPDSKVGCNYQTDTWSGDASNVGYSVNKLSGTNGNPASFSVQVNANKGTTEVVGYPSTQCLLYSAIPSTLTSSYNITPPAASSGLDYEYAYDVWLTTASAAQSGSWSGDLELMIWNDVNGQVPAGSFKSSLSDGSKVWVAGSNTSGTVSVVLPKTDTSGTVDIASIISQLKSDGYITANDNGILDVEYGIEAPYGGGQTFTVNSLSLSESGSTTTPTPTDSSPTIAGYYVLRNGVNITPNMVTSTNYTDTSVVANTAYMYSVEAVDSAKNVSAPSPAVSVTTPKPVDTTPPTQPTGLMATAASPSQINLQWKASTDSIGVAGYYVYRNGIKIATVTTTSYGDANLSASTKYSYYVVAFDGAGNKSTASATVSATTQTQATKTLTMEGTVRNLKTGTPISNAYVHTGTVATAHGMAFAYTNTSGQYVLTGLIPNKQHYYSFSSSNYLTDAFYLTLRAGTRTEYVNLAPAAVRIPVSNTKG
jgi:chitodextrinase